MNTEIEVIETTRNDSAGDYLYHIRAFVAIICICGMIVTAGTLVFVRKALPILQNLDETTQELQKSTKEVLGAGVQKTIEGLQEVETEEVTNGLREMGRATIEGWKSKVNPK